MVDAKIYYSDDGFVARLSGHAGYAPKGQDIVCAGVSALTIALLNTVSYSVEVSSQKGFNVKLADGDFLIELFGMKDREIIKEINALFLMFQTGLEKIESAYPDFVKVESFYIPSMDEYNDTSEQTMNENERKEG